jgi:S1-C subfamily serine protease
MYADAIARMAGSIFPIFQVEPQMHVSGTGFFIDHAGLFVTAAHVAASAPAESGLYYYGNIPDRVCEPVEIECVAADPRRDLYLGRVARDELPPVKLSAEAVRPGDSVCIAGYPMAVLATSAQGGMVGNVRRYWQPTCVVDTANVTLEPRVYEGFLTQHACLHGMDGGPVFDMAGNVRGLAATTLTRTIAGDPTPLQNAIVVDFEHLRAFIAQHVPDWDP